MGLVMISTSLCSPIRVRIRPFEAKNRRRSNESTSKAGRPTGINDSAEGAGCPFLKETAAIFDPVFDLSLALGVAPVTVVCSR